MQRDKFGVTRGNGNTPVGTKVTSHLQGPKNRFFFFYLTKLKSVILSTVYKRKMLKI